MKISLRCCLLAAAVILAACDSGALSNPDAMRKQAAQSLGNKNFGEAANQAEALSRKAPDDFEAHFLLAQAQAQLGNKNAALAALEAAINKGYKDDQAIAANTNLEPIRNMPAYLELMASAFPQRAASSAGAALIPDTAPANNAVGIIETNDKTVIRAGDVVVEMPKN